MISSVVDSVNIIDFMTEQWFFSIRDGFWFEIFKAITTLGTIVFSSCILICLTGIAAYRKKVFFTGAMWLCYLLSEGTTWGLKFLIKRQRPEIIDGVFESNPSFPSGHSTAITYVTICIMYIIFIMTPSVTYRVLITVLSIFLLIAVLFSRMYLNLHYLSDVTVGALIGLVWGCIFMKLARNNLINSFLIWR